MRRCHGFPHHTYQFAVKGLQARLIPKLGREGFEGLPHIVLAAVEATVYEGLDARRLRLGD